MTYRVAMHRCSPASAVEVDHGMSIDDVVDAHAILDAIDAQTERDRREST